MNDKTDVGFILIDAPVGPYSSKEEIIAWIEELKTMPQINSVPESIVQAQEWLNYQTEAKKNKSSR